MTTRIENRLQTLREIMRGQGIDGVIIPHTDEFGSEYLPQSAERLAFVTGFTGSSGVAVLLKDKALAMTDGRYTIQIKQQVDANLFDIRDMADVTVGEWIAANAARGNVIGYDAKLHTPRHIESIESKLEGTGITLKAMGVNLVDAVWTDRPAAPQGQIEIFPDAVAGATSQEKRQRIANGLRGEKIKSVIVTLSDSICWVLNIRGSDIDYNPLVLSYLILHDDARADWYIDAAKVTDGVKSALGADIRLHPFENFAKDVASQTGPVQYDNQRSSIWIENLLKSSGVDAVAGKDPCIMPKACKTIPEQRAIGQAHIRDGVAFVKFLYWLETQNVDDGHLTELMIEEKLEEFRKGDATYRGPSFSTIAGWAGHGAIIHYRSTPDSNAVITGNGFLLLDSGGQYEYGTTDITRTIVVGDVTAEMKDRFARVMKGHIALASARFSPETEGVALDNLARQPLIDEGLNFAHGTGHGVGCFLCVHEEATSISPRGKDRMRPGMLVSNEPGYYKEGEYGIRHENLILCREADDGNYYFDTITCVPFDARGIDWDVMTDAEKDWLENYHRHVFETLSPFLNEDEVRFLESITIPETDDRADDGVDGNGEIISA